MAENQSSRNSPGACEKIYNATVGPAFRTIRSISPCPQNSKPANPAPNSPLPNRFLHQPNSSEVIPIEFNPQVFPTPPNEKEKMAKPYSSIQKNGQVTKVAKSDSKNEANPPVVSVQENSKHKVDIAPPSNIVVAKSHGQGTEPTTKIELAKPSVPVQEQQHFKPKVEAASAVKAVATKNEPPHDKGEAGMKLGQYNGTDEFSANIDRDKNKMRTKSNVGDANGDYSRLDSLNNKVSNYINRAKFKFRTKSNTGIANSDYSRLDSLNDKVSNYINRKKIKMGTTSNTGGGKSVSFK